MVRSLTYVELLKKDGMEEESDEFCLYSSFSLRVATCIKLTSGTIYTAVLK